MSAPFPSFLLLALLLLSSSSLSPRYNRVAKTLELRQGRCGEYSALLFQLALALGYRARWVVDWTDHLWVELAIDQRQSEQRQSEHHQSEQHQSRHSSDASSWMHADPCEASLDEPHLYEGGWGKNLTYVVAFGSDGAVEEVTRDYVLNMSATLHRRNLSEADVSRELKRIKRLFSSRSR